jgi:hypothetical protein
VRLASSSEFTILLANHGVSGIRGSMVVGNLNLQHSTFHQQNQG